jgi:hypothetical protein
MHRYDEPSNKSAASSPSRSLVDYITNTSGYNFRKGQELINAAPGGPRLDRYLA